ncbi:hypothetical protein [Rathayibacter sp. VKM Ac-2878]|uniref:hypothetical protein n=1 Tax=Rathayibacter sp. VKM Ac-2878 TaxID=2783831 RepID=UPI002B27B918|nr:hypothetical protein [Rathayibacter sp. VKM Ac-2878]
MISEQNRPIDGRRARRLPPGLVVLIVVLAVETVAVSLVALWLVVELLSTPADTVGGGVAIVVLALIALGWAAATTAGAVRRRGWMRGSALTMQLVQAAVALGTFQGHYAVPEVGWALLAPAALGAAMVLLPSVVAATRREEGPV